MNSILELNPVAFWGIRWYAICILLGIVIAVIMGLKEGKKLGIYSDFIYIGVIICVPLAIVGARLWYVIFNPSQFDNLADILGLSGGGLSGLAIQGGVIASIIFVVVYSRKKNMKLYRVFDILAPGFLIGQICGRWGNFFNSELYGPVVKNVGLFKRLLPSFITENMYIGGDYRHPTFLYESLLNLVGFILILVLRRKSKRLKSGDTIGIYLAWYGAVRIFTETLRLKGDPNDPLMLLGMPVSILVSVLFIIAGISFLVIKRFKGPNENYRDILKEIEESRYDTILFDLDGTLLNTKPLIDKSFIYTFSHFFPDLVLTDDDLNSFFGPTLHDTFKRYEEDESKIEEMMSFYREFNVENHDAIVKPFDGCKQLLKILHDKHYNVGIVSNKKFDVVSKGLNLFMLDKYIDVIISADDIEKPKPNPSGILKAIDKFPNAKNVLYVGDHPNDIEAGKNADRESEKSIKTCGVMYSTHKDKLEEIEPDYMIYQLNDLLKILIE